MSVSLKIKRITKLRDAETVTVDGEHAELAANIGTPMIYMVLWKMALKELVFIEQNFYIWVEIKCQLKTNNLKRIKSFRNYER